MGVGCGCFFPFFLDPFTYAKQVVVAFALSVLPLFAGLVLRKCLVLELPRFNYPLVFIPLCGVALGYLGSIFFNWPGLFFIPVAEVAGGAVAVFVCISFFCKWPARFRYFLALSALSVVPTMGYWLLQLNGVDFLRRYQSNAFPTSFFGYQNFFGEYAGISFIVLAYFSSDSRLRVPYKCFIFVGLVTCAFCIVSLDSRTSSYGVLFALLFTILLKFLSEVIPIFRGCGLIKTTSTAKVRNFRTLVKFVPLGILIAAMGATSLIRKSNPSFLRKPNTEQVFAKLSDIKSQNIEIRKARWLNTIELIKDHPLGIGPGNFEFGYFPYRNSKAEDPEANASMIPKSPHNGILELASENGLFTLACFLWLVSGVAFLLLVKYWRVAQFRKGNLILLSLSVLSFLAFDGSFNFPAETPFPFFAFVIFSGFALSQVSTLPTRRVNAKKIAVAGYVVAALLSFYTAVLAFAHWSEKQGSAELKLRACIILPDIWRNCLDSAYTSLRLQKPDLSLIIVDKLIEKNTWMSPAREAKIYALIRMGDLKNACVELNTLRRVDKYFPTFEGLSESDCEL